MHHTTQGENLIIARVLETLSAPSQYVWVDKETHLSRCTNTRRPENLPDLITWVAGQFSEAGYEIRQLVEKLYDINRELGVLTLKSSIVDGYWIDHENKMDQYIKTDDVRGGWSCFSSQNPGAQVFVTVSRPVHDQPTDMVLIGVSIEGEGSGSYCVHLYQFGSGIMRLLAKVCVGHASFI